MDLRGLVREALRVRVADTAWWPPEDAARFHNRLLDDVGDAARPEVALLMRLHARDIGGRLPPAVLTREAWVRARGTLVTILANELAADGAVEPGALAWAIDSWAIALAVVEPELLEPAPAGAMRAQRGRGGAPARGTTRAGSRGGARAGTPGAGASPVRALAPRAAPTPNHWTHRWPIDTLTFIGMGVLGLLMASLEFGAAWQTRQRNAAEARAAQPRRDEGQRALVRASAALGATPALSGVGGTHDAPRAASPGDVQPASDAEALPPGVADTVQLRAGRTITGAITLVTATHLYVTEARTAHSVEVALADVARAVTRRGLPLDLTPRGDSAGPSLLVRGIAGRYAVRRRVLAATGDTVCATAARSVDPAVTTEEVIAHARGTTTFTMPSRPGVTGRIAPDGTFETDVLSGARAMGEFSWHMSGHFTPNGFVAEADAATEVVTKWRSSAACRFVTELIGVRRP
ncbi:MAG: hypothetical protein HY275_10080 [Gemmatimonadetes bacterium]|nr:hypothetical protein [Gemmatimonadota bacterium]